MAFKGAVPRDCNPAMNPEELRTFCNNWPLQRIAEPNRLFESEVILQWRSELVKDQPVQLSYLIPLRDPKPPKNLATVYHIQLPDPLSRGNNYLNVGDLINSPMEQFPTQDSALGIFYTNFHKNRMKKLPACIKRAKKHYRGWVDALLNQETCTESEAQTEESETETGLDETEPGHMNEAELKDYNAFLKTSISLRKL